MDKSKVKKAHEIPLSQAAIQILCDKMQNNTLGENDFIYFGGNDLEGRRYSVFVKKKDWDGDWEALKNE